MTGMGAQLNLTNGVRLFWSEFAKYFLCLCFTKCEQQQENNANNPVCRILGLAALGRLACLYSLSSPQVSR